MPHHRRQVRVLERQPDLLSAPRPTEATAAPGWSSLPEGAQQAVTVLITRLLVMHAADVVLQPEGDADER
jgi:hypothetical protein